MGRIIKILAVFPVMTALSFLGADGNGSQAEPPKLAQVVYISTSKACGGLLDRCQAGDWVVEKTFAGEKMALLKLIDVAVDQEGARAYIKKFRLPLPPALFFLDQNGNLLFRFDGEIDMELLEKRLKEFGA